MKRPGSEEIEDLQISEGGHGHSPYEDITFTGIQDDQAPDDRHRGLPFALDARLAETVVSRPRDATRHARELFESMDHTHHLLCLRFVRECLEVPAYYINANQAWANAKHKVAFTDEDAVPFGAPVFLDKIGGTTAGHVVLAGGRFRSDRRRIFWTTDQFADGRVTPVRGDFFTDQWGYYFKGFTRDLNTVGIPYLLDSRGR